MLQSMLIISLADSGGLVEYRGVERLGTGALTKELRDELSPDEAD